MILVDCPMYTPMDSTEPSPTITPSATSARAPMKQLSSMMTGFAWIGSSTPPMPAPPERCTFLPIWAHDPTVAQVSTIVPESTYAPMLTNDGIRTAPGATYAPQRTIAPATTRTPSSWLVSGTLSWYLKSPTCDRTMGSTRNASSIA